MYVLAKGDNNHKGSILYMNRFGLLLGRYSRPSPVHPSCGNPRQCFDFLMGLDQVDNWVDFYIYGIVNFSLDFSSLWEQETCCEERAELGLAPAGFGSDYVFFVEGNFFFLEVMRVVVEQWGFIFISLLLACSSYTPHSIQQRHERVVPSPVNESLVAIKITIHSSSMISLTPSKLESTWCGVEAQHWLETHSRVMQAARVGTMSSNRVS